jgi:peptide/nickel transport system substrate-binding protein
MSRVLFWALVALALTACGRGGLDRKRAGTLIVGRLSEPISLNPLYLQGSDQTDIGALIYSSLTRYDSQGRTNADVATEVPSVENGGISHDGTTITYHLRRDVKWQDGFPLTAADVAFTYRASVDPANTFPAQNLYGPVARVSACARYVVCVRLQRPYAPIVATFFGGDGPPILPQHLLQRYRSLDAVGFDSAPIGSGPYRVAKWVRGDRLDLIANASYFRGKPPIENISIRILPNHSTILNQLRSHEIDVAFFANPAKIAAYRSLDGDTTIVTRNRPSFSTIVFNLTDPVVRTLDVRRALQFALDRDEIAKKATSGVYDAATGLRGLFGWAYDPGADAVKQNMQRARSILDGAGWAVGPDGIRVRNAQRLSLQLTYFGQSFAANAVVPLIVEQAKAVGIEVDPKPYDVNALFARSGPLYHHTFQLALLGLQSNLFPNPTLYLACDQRTPVGFNFASYCSPPVDRAIDQALSTYNPAIQRTSYRYVQRAVVRDVPYLFLWQASEVDVISKRLSGYEPNGGGGPYASVADWSLRN